MPSKKITKEIQLSASQAPIINAQAFIDWDSARRIKKLSVKHEQYAQLPMKDRIGYVQDCFSEIQVRTAAALEQMSLGGIVRVLKSRIYHGWHRGVTATDDRRAWAEARRDLRAHVTSKASYLPDVEYGNELSCGGARVPIMDTLRKRPDGLDEQKMVDTALVADLLSFGRAESRNFRRGSQPNVIALVIADDDDLLAGVFMVEQWGLPVAVLRIGRDSESKHLKLSGLIHKL